MHDLDTVKKAANALNSKEFDIIMICIATWSEDHHLLDLLSYIDKPVILRAYPARETGRFPEIEEDEAPIHLLCNEYK